MKIIVSACLVGFSCRYDGQANTVDWIKRLYEKGFALPVCPECFGGLSTPRTPCEIIENKVISAEGKDCTKEFLYGAFQALLLAKQFGANFALLKAKSPSCGVTQIYDGTFTRQLIFGDGMFTKILRQNNFFVCTEKDDIGKYIKNYYDSLYGRNKLL